MKATIKSLLSMLCFGLLVSCNPKKQETKYYYLSDGLKDYFGYQNGTYWILKDSLTGNIDSLVATNYQVIQRNLANDVVAEEAAAYLISYHLANGDKDTMRLLVDADTYAEYSFLNNSSNNNRLNGYFTYKYPFSAISQDGIETTSLATATINNTVYSNVYRYYYQIDNQHFDEILINHDSGFVRIVFNDQIAHRILQLQHSNVVRSH